MARAPSTHVAHPPRLVPAGGADLGWIDEPLRTQPWSCDGAESLRHSHSIISQPRNPLFQLPPSASSRVNTVKDPVETFRWRAIDRERTRRENLFKFPCRHPPSVRRRDLYSTVKLRHCISMLIAVHMTTP